MSRAADMAEEVTKEMKLHLSSIFSFIFESLNQFQGRAVCGKVRWESVNPWVISFPALTATK